MQPQQCPWQLWMWQCHCRALWNCSHEQAVDSGFGTATWSISPFSGGSTARIRLLLKHQHNHCNNCSYKDPESSSLSSCPLAFGVCDTGVAEGQGQGGGSGAGWALQGLGSHCWGEMERTAPLAAQIAGSECILGCSHLPEVTYFRRCLNNNNSPIPAGQ